MPIPFSCQSCGRNLRVKDELAGNQIYCPDCKSILTVPSPTEDVFARRDDAFANRDDAFANRDDAFANRDDVPMAEVAPETDEAYLMRSESATLPRKPTLADDPDRDWDDAPRPRPKGPPPAPPSSGAGAIGSILGGIAAIFGCGALIMLGLIGGFWIPKLIIILGIVGVVLLFKGLFNIGD